MASRPAGPFPTSFRRRCRAKGYDVKVVNAGVSGDTAEDGLARFDWACRAMRMR